MLDHAMRFASGRSALGSRWRLSRLQSNLLVVVCLCCLVAGGEPANAQLDNRGFDAGVLSREQLPEERTLKYDFRSVQVQTIERWLSWLNLDLPFAASGEVSGWIWAQRSSEGLFNFRDYWLEAEIRSPELGLEDWTVQNANLRLGYRRGTWFLGGLTGRVVPPEAESTKVEGVNRDASNAAKNVNQLAGQFAVAGKLPTGGDRRLQLNGTIDEVNLQRLLEGLAVHVPMTNRGGSLEFNASVPTDRMEDLKYWSGNARLAITGLKVPQVRDPLLVSADATVRDGRWSIHDSQFSLEAMAAAGVAVELGANGGLAEPGVSRRGQLATKLQSRIYCVSSSFRLGRSRSLAKLRRQRPYAAPQRMALPNSTSISLRIKYKATNIPLREFD